MIEKIIDSYKQMKNKLRDVVKCKVSHSQFYE